VRCLVAIAFGLALVAGTAAAQYAYISTSDSGFTGSISVINTFTNSVAATISLDGQPLGVAVNSAGTYVYAAMPGGIANRVAVIKTATNSVVATVNVGNSPQSVAVNPSGTYVYVTNTPDGTVSVINAAINTVTDTVSVGQGPDGLAVNPAGSYVYVANGSDGTVSVINATTNSIAATVNVGGAPYGVAVGPDGSYVYVTNISGYVSVINAATNSVVATVNVAGVNGGNAPRGVAINAAGTYVYVASYDPARNSGNAVSVISTATNTAVATVNLPSNDLSHPCGIAVNPTGTKVFVAFHGGTMVAVLDTGTNAITTTVKVGGTIDAFIGYFIGGQAIPPSISTGGIVSSASYTASAPVAPGSLVSVFGTFPVDTAQANAAPLPTTLSGLSAQFNGTQAPLFYVSGTQVNAQVPWELQGQPQASVTVSAGGTTSAPQKVTLANVGLGVFAVNGQGQGAVLDAMSGQLISPINPAKAGTTYISIYCTGLGPVTNQPPTGTPASASVRSETLLQPTVMIGGIRSDVLYSGLAPTFVGLYQINVQVPPAVPSGDAVPLVISIGGATAPAVTIAISAGQ